MRHRWLTSIVACLVVLLVLSGCVTQQTQTTITSDGSGTNVILFGFTKDLMQQLGEEDPFAEINQDVADFPAEWQAQITPWEDSTYQGFRLSMNFADLAMLETQLNRILGPDANTNNGRSSTGMLEQITVQQEGNTIVISSVLKQDESSQSGEQPPAEMFTDFKISWSIDMPSLQSYSEEGIATRDGNRVTWTFPFVAERDYTLEARGSFDGSTATTPASPTPSTSQPVQTGELPGERCFDEVSYCITGRIRQYWEQNGGLPVFGFPIAPQQEEMIEGKPYQVQWFERNRLELHPENQPPYDVLLGRLGVDVLTKQGRDWQSFAKSDAQDGCMFFPDTGHNVCGDILLAWQASGLEIDGQPGFSHAENTALFGLPVSGQIEETLSDGNTYQVQYFERARFELHPENQPPYHVLFGLLGTEVRN